MKKMKWLLVLLAALFVLSACVAQKSERVYSVLLVSGQEVSAVTFEVEFLPAGAVIAGRNVRSGVSMSVNRETDGLAFVEVWLDEPLSEAANLFSLWSEDVTSMKLTEGSVRLCRLDNQSVHGELRLERIK